jgi:two-component SAPR family response regulator
MATKSRPPRVLVVEDEFFIAMELEAVLEASGCVVLGPAPSVGTVLNLLEVERPDCAVLDVSVRGEWITPVAELLATMEVPFILASAYGDRDFESAVLQNALNVGKPTDPARLVRTVHTLTSA